VPTGNPFDEFQKLQQAMSHKPEVMSEELKDYHVFLQENDLVTAFRERKEEREAEAEFALLEMKIAGKKADEGTRRKENRKTLVLQSRKINESIKRRHPGNVSGDKERPKLTSQTF
jgi:hypothetical protein